ncbi:MAG: hypothetical protein Q9207_007750 [Kuettlingeria erythrocarpa]
MRLTREQVAEQQTVREVQIEAALAECDKKLEPIDRERAQEVNNIDDFRNELNRLLDEYPDDADAPRHVILLLYPTLDHFEQFTQSFVKMMSQKVETCMLWGLLYLVIKLSLESRGTIERITRMLEQIGHKLRRLNECSSAFSDTSKIKGDTVEINREIVILWLNIIMFFRTQSQSMDSRENHLILQKLSALYNEAMSTIGDAVGRIEKAAELTERQARMIDVEMFSKMLSLNPGKDQSGQIPFCVLPVARNRRFFGREKILAEIDDQLQPGKKSGSIRSLAIHGLGGVGKTQIALEYAYSKQAELDAVLWVPAENTLALQQGFTKIAVDGLKLPNANPQSHQENMLLVVAWLQQTSAKWLLVFDNVESHQIFENCWPAADHGAILVTTRRHMVASQPIDHGIEIVDFTIDDGAKFILHLLQKRQGTTEEQTAATDLSTLLHGYALAISQMTAYMNARTMPIKDFLSLYKKYPKRMHRERKEGWKYIGYNYALDTVWDISFDALEQPAKACLWVLSFYAPDSIPTTLLEPSENLALPPRLEFCKDELSRWDAIEQLTDHALVRHDTSSQRFSLHRLVQAECLFRISTVERQEGFDGAVKLLLDKFPSRGNLVIMDSLWEDGAKYLQQIAAVATNWKESQDKPAPLEPTVDFCNLMADCAWFVHDNDAAGILSLVIDTGCKAYYKLSEDSKQPILEADLLLLLCIRDLRAEGDFKSAETQGKRSLVIREELKIPQDLQITNCYNYIAIALDSLGQHDEAKKWLEKSREILVANDDELHVRLLSQNNLNYSRNLFSVEDFTGSEKKLDQALVQATGFKSWYSLAFIHQTKADLYLRWDKSAEANKQVQLARTILEGSGGYASISWISGIVSYRTSSVAMKQNYVDIAIQEAQKAVAIARLYKMPPGMRARFVHLLMKAYLLEPDQYREKAEEARHEAQRLRKLLPPGRTDLNDESDQAFDMLVDISVR